MICYYPYKIQSFSGKLPLRPSCFYIINRDPERRIGLCHLLQNHVHTVIQNYEGKHSQVMLNIS